MNLFINSPAYYTREHGVIDEIYKLCAKISREIDITRYTDELDTIGIVPVIAPEDERKNGKFKEEKRISLPYRMASISLVTDYDDFCNAELAQKEQMIVENIFRSLNVIKRRLKERFDYERMRADIIELLSDSSENMKG